jgi:beta-xylosidase
MQSFSLLPALLLSIFTAVKADNPDSIGVQLNGKSPVIATNFPDPCLAYDNTTKTWYSFSTQSGHTNVQMATSKDFSTWVLHDGYDALPTVGSWARPSPHAAVWAPDVNQRPDGSWVMYYAALHRHRHQRRHCIGAATSDTIAGPYAPLNTTLVCDLPHGGNIDPNLFLDPLNGAAYLVYKTDGDTIGHGGSCGNTIRPIAPTPIYMQLLDPTSLLTPIDPPIFLFSNGPTDGPNVERPCITFLNGTYFILYNSECFQSRAYHVDYVSCVGATDVTMCDWATLKYDQSRWREPLLKTGDTLANLHAPGSVDTDGERMVFHADVDLAWFDQPPPPPPKKKGQEQGRPRVKRDRAMFAADLDVDSEAGTLRVKGLYS